MSYAFQQLVEQDVPVGYQTVNQARDNLIALREVLVAEHGYGMPPLAGGIRRGAGGNFGSLSFPNWRTLGQHNSTKIQRAAAYVSFLSPFYGTSNSTPYFQWASSAMLSVSRFSWGSYMIPVSGLSVYWATATCYGTSASQKLFATVRPYYPPSGSPGTPAIFVQTFELSTGAFGPADGIDFSVHIYGHLA